MRLRIFGALPLLFTLWAAGAARAQAPAPCDRKPISDPAYYADIKAFPPGKFGFGYSSDMAQFKDPAAPAALTGLASHSAKRPFAVKLGCAEVENRTTRFISSVRLRWAVSATPPPGQNAPEKAEPLAKGLTSVFYVEVPPGEKRKFELRGVQMADFFWPLATSGEVNGSFNVVIGVARVEFTDGTALDLP